MQRVQEIGPGTRIPVDMLRERVLVCFGEDPGEFWAAVPSEPGPTHRYRGVEAAIVDDILCVLAPWGSAVVEMVMYELAPRIRRIILVGTAGSMPDASIAPMRPFVADPAASAFQNFDSHPKASWSPSVAVALPAHAIISTDRFYGFSPLLAKQYPAEPALHASWRLHASADAAIDMEVAPFYHYAQAFGAPDLQYAAIKAVANPVEDLHALAQGSAPALHAVLQAAWPIVQA